MNILHKSILTIISIGIFVFLIFATFLTKPISDFEKPFYLIKSEGNYKLIQKDDNFILSNDLINNSGSISVTKINISDKIFYNYGNISTTKSNNKININLTPGVFYLSLKEINTKYLISGEGFSIINKGPGNFIVNNLNPRKIIIFSIDSLLELKLKNIKTNEDITTISLYPHMYLVFNPIKNIFVKNSDLLKISQTFVLGYYSSNISVSENFLNLILLRKEKGAELLKNVISFLEKEKIEKEKYIQKYKKYIFGTLPGEKLISKYNILFLNPSKKDVYYKNLIIRKTNDLLDSKTNESLKITEILDYLNKLKELDIKSYNEVKNIILFHYSNVIITNQDAIVQINFSKLINKINGFDNSFSLKSLIYLEKVFSEYNSNSFYEDINIFTEKYFNDLKISIDGNDKRKGNISELKDIDYLLYFIENIMMNTSLDKIKNINHTINTFDNYMTIASTFYSYSNENIRRIGLYINLDLLNKFKKIINQYYFNNREDGKILTIKNNKNIIKKDILKLEKNINKIFDFFENNKNVLNINNSNKDKFLSKKLYPNLKEEYKEYFYALKDYDEYLSIYDETINEILTTKSINEKDNNKVILSIQNAKDYLSVFNGISFNNTKISIMDYSYCENPSKELEDSKVETPFCYKIDNLLVNNRPLSFVLYPFLNNKIDNIYYSDKAKSGSYKLDDIKIELNEKIKNVTKNKELYEFSNFLVNTFSPNHIISYNNTTETEANNKEEQDSTFVRIFKRNKLLGNLGDFNHLNGKINILYDDLNVKRDGDKYNIYIDTAKFEIQLNRKSVFMGELSSSYIFTDKHSFINPKIKLIHNKSKKDLLLGNYIYITGEYPVNEIEDGLKIIFKSYNEINFIIKSIYNNLYIKNIKITYNKKTNIYGFHFNYEGNDVLIKYKNGLITGIYKNGSLIPNSDSNYRNIDLLLNNINKKND